MKLIELMEITDASYPDGLTKLYHDERGAQ